MAHDLYVLSGGSSSHLWHSVLLALITTPGGCSWMDHRHVRAGLRRVDRVQMKGMPNEITGANAGGAPRFQIRTLWTARIAQFWR